MMMSGSSGGLRRLNSTERGRERKNEQMNLGDEERSEEVVLVTERDRESVHLEEREEEREKEGEKGPVGGGGTQTLKRRLTVILLRNFDQK